MFVWDAQRIEWYERALRLTGFAGKLVDEVVSYLSMKDKICDLGCGTGYMALGLYNRGYHVGAVDRSEEAIRYLREKAQKEGKGDMEIVCGNWEELLKDRKWDTIIMCFTGTFRTEFWQYFNACKKQLILVTKEHKVVEKEKSGKNNYRLSSEEMAEMLNKGRVPYERKTLDLEFGQPLRDIKEAEDYLNCYNHKYPNKEEILKNLRETGNREFPLYFPIPKRVAIYRMIKTSVASR